MEIHQLTKEQLMRNKKEIELFQTSAISAVSALFYSEYIRRFKQREFPTKIIMVPSIKSVTNYISHGSIFMKWLSDNFIDSIKNHPLIKKYIEAPEMIIFNEDNIDVVKTLFDTYISLNIINTIPRLICKKFDLDNEKQQLFRETFDIRLFEDQPIKEDQYKFIIDHTVIQLLILSPSIEKVVEIPEDHMNMMMSNGEILTINNENAICSIYFTDEIIRNKSVIDTLSFVTNTTIVDISGKNNVDYIVNSSSHNNVSFTKLKDINFE